ncbi:MAG: penicillin-binding protein 2 [Caldilineales bacterium]|nr:penicillin-binding protein 2 [Caldilineales bacterium]MDW8316294.1 penicillin-binding protein 2 [Anaerolineae bacterium]
MSLPTRTAHVRIVTVAVVLLTAFLVLVAQLVRWQLLDRKGLTPVAAAADLAPLAGRQRGTIVDRTGEPLAMDIYRWEIWVQPSLVSPSRADTLSLKLAQALGPLLTMTPAELASAIAGRQARFITLTKYAPPEVANAIAAWDESERYGVGMAAVPVRYYPQGPLTAHLIGFVNEMPQAYYGVEEKYTEYLRRAGDPFFQSSPSARQAYDRLPPAWRRFLPSAVGQDLVLTVDRRVQYATEQALGEAIGRYGATSGTAIVMDPYTGWILAMVSLPSYDPNRYNTTNTAVLADPAISVPYEPGSVLKVVTMAAGIDAGLITPDTIITDTQTLEFGGRIIQNWDRSGLGPITVRQALIRSRNVPTAQVAIGLGESLFYQYLSRFGFGQLTEVDLANEVPGTLKRPGDPQWSRSDLATNSFGQGLAATPLQVVTAVASIANGGQLVRPRVVQAMVYRGQVIEQPRTVVRRTVKPETAETVRRMMVDVVEQGTRSARVPGYTVAGKTGTAQIAIEGRYHPTQTIHSFVGFVPAENPQLVILVKLDKPRTHAWAESTAAPTFAELVRQLVYLLNIPPSQVANRP